MRVVAFDPSLTATGVCDAEGKTYRVGGDAKVGDRRLQKIYDLVLEVAAVADYALMEDLPTHAQGAGKTGMAQGVVRLALVQLAVPFTTVTPASLKKFATGSGNADKADMRMSLFQRAGIDLKDDNQVDAWWLRALGLHHFGEPLVDLPSKHLEALRKVEWA